MASHGLRRRQTPSGTDGIAPPSDTSFLETSATRLACTPWPTTAPPARSARLLDESRRPPAAPPTLHLDHQVLEIRRRHPRDPRRLRQRHRPLRGELLAGLDRQRAHRVVR